MEVKQVIAILSMTWLAVNIKKFLVGYVWSISIIKYQLCIILLNSRFPEVGFAREKFTYQVFLEKSGWIYMISSTSKLDFPWLQGI